MSDIKLPTVIPCHCGAECVRDDTDGEPCYGKVEVVDEAGQDDDGSVIWFHCCEGHKDCVIDAIDAYIPYCADCP